MKYIQDFLYKTLAEIEAEKENTSSPQLKNYYKRYVKLIKRMIKLIHEENNK